MFRIPQEHYSHSSLASKVITNVPDVLARFKFEEAARCTNGKGAS